MSLNDLQNLLQQQAGQNQGMVTISAAVLQRAGLAPVTNFDLLVSSWLKLNTGIPVQLLAPIAAPTGDTLAFDGRASLLGATSVPVRVAFRLASGTLNLTLSVQLGNAWALSTTSPMLKGRIFDSLLFNDAHYVFTTGTQETYSWQQNIALKQGLNFCGSLVVAGMFQALEILLEGFTGSTAILFSGPMDTTKISDLAGGTPLMSLAGTLGGSVKAVPNFPLTNPRLAIQTVLDLDGTPFTRLCLVTTLSLNTQPIGDVSTQLLGDTGVLNFWFAPAAAITPQQIIQLLGGEDFTQSIPAELQSAFGAFGLRSLAFGLHLKTFSITMISAGIGTSRSWNMGQFTMEDLVMRCTILDPFGQKQTSFSFGAKSRIFPNVFPGEFEVEITVAPASKALSVAAGYTGSVSLSKLVQGISNGQVDLNGLGFDITFTDFSMSFSRHSDGTYFYTLYGASQEAVQLPFMESQLKASLQVSIDSAAGSYQLTGGMALGDIWLNAEIDIGQAQKLLTASWGSGGQPLDLSGLTSELGFPMELQQVIAGLQVKYLTVVYDFKTSSFQLLGDTTLLGQIPLGAQSYQLETRAYLSSSVDSSGKRTSTGHLEADLQIGESLFAVSFAFDPKVKLFKGRWSSAGGTTLGFADIAQSLGIHGSVATPEGLDLTLKAAAFQYDAANENFTLAASSAKFGDAFFTAGKGQSGWGFVFGGDFPPKSRLSSLPMIGNQLKPADFLTFKTSAMMIASTTFPNYTPPLLPPLPAPVPTAGPLSGRLTDGRAVKPAATGASLQLSPGWSLAADLDFSGSSHDARVKNLQSIVGQTDLILQITVGEQGLSLTAKLPGKVGIPTGKSKLALGSPSIRIDLADEIVFQLSGSMSMTINGAVILATARLIIDETEAQVAIDISGDHAALPPPPRVKGLHLEDFGLIMGVFFEPPGVDLGIQGKCRIGEVQGTKDNEFAMILEVIEEVPNLLYLSFYIDEMDLGQVVTLFTDRQEPGIVQSMEIVKAYGLSFRFAENVVVLPDGSIAQPGFGLSASIQLLSWGGHVDLQVGATDGIHGTAELSPINLRNVLVISGDGKGIKRIFQQTSGTWQLVTNSSIVRTLPAPPVRQETIIAPGGPVLQFNCLKSPFIHASLMVSLFDLQKAKIDATLSTSGISFVLTYTVDGIEKFNMSCSLQDRDHFSASGLFHFKLDAIVGPIHVQGINFSSIHLVTNVDANVAVILDPSRFSMDVSGGFNFQGIVFTFPRIALTVAPSSLKELPGKVLGQIRGFADQIFGELFKDAQRWAGMIGQGIITGVDDMATGLNTVFHLTSDEAAKLMKSARLGENLVCAGLNSAYHLTADAAAATMKGAGYAAGEVASGLHAAYKQTAAETAVMLKGAGFAVNDVGNALRTAFGLPPQAAAQVLKGAGYALNDVNSALHNAYGAMAQQAAQWLSAAGYAVNDVGGVLKTFYGTPASQAGMELRMAGYAAGEIGNALKNTWGAGEDQTAQLLHDAGYSVNDVGNALKSSWGKSSDAIGRALKNAGYDVDKVGGFLKDTFKMGPDQLNKALSNAGFSSKQINGFFKSLGGDFSKAIDSIGDVLGL
ncbi:MAG: hypothetical protein LAO78_25605 [Acidobacteriia bacterium]|nr:hypothetical protein [Terriglobia bacterium]